MDTVAHSPAALEYCYKMFGADRLLYGTDHPQRIASLHEEITTMTTGWKAARESRRAQLDGGSRQTAKEFNLNAANGDAVGIWSDGEKP